MFRGKAETIFQRIWRECDFILTDSIGALGGLAILWKPCNVSLSRSFATIVIIRTHFEITGSHQMGTITNVYGPKSQHEKEKLLERLIFIKTLLTTSNLILGGNFNMILSLEEKTGGSK